MHLPFYEINLFCVRFYSLQFQPHLVSLFYLECFAAFRNCCLYCALSTFILFNTLAWEEISGCAPFLFPIRLLELWACLSFYSFIYPSISVRTIHHVPKASCHSDCPSGNNQSWSKHPAHRKKMERGLKNSSGYFLIMSPSCLSLHSSVELFLMTPQPAVFSISILFPRSSITPSLSPLAEEPIGGMCRCVRVSSYLPPFEAARQWAVHLRPHSSLQTCGKVTLANTMPLA